MFVPKGFSALAPGLYTMYMYKIIKNVYKITFRRDNFETCNMWAKRKGLSVVIKILSSVDCLPLPWGYICMMKHGKNVYKIDFKAIFFKPATFEQNDKGFLLSSAFVPKGLSAPALGLYTCIKTLKDRSGPGVRSAFTGPLVLWFHS